MKMTKFLMAFLKRHEKFESVEELYFFIDELIQKMDSQNLEDAAQQLKEFRSISWTSSSELMGELGLIIRKIQQEYRLPRHIKSDTERIIAEVRRIWPSL